MSPELKALNRLRTNLRARISTAYKKGRPLEELVQEYNELIDKLYSKGYPVDHRIELPDEIRYISKSKPKDKPQQETPAQAVPEAQQEYQSPKMAVINIAWTESEKEKDTNLLNLLDEYMRSISEADIYDDSSECGNFEVEHIIKYKFKTTKEGHAIIKKTANFIADKTKDPEKQGVEIFGKILEN